MLGAATEKSEGLAANGALFMLIRLSRSSFAVEF